MFAILSTVEMLYMKHKSSGLVGLLSAQIVIGVMNRTYLIKIKLDFIFIPESCSRHSIYQQYDCIN